MTGCTHGPGPANLKGSIEGANMLYQGTVTMLALFMGFLFTTLVEVYVDGNREVGLVRMLVVAIMLFLIALLSFHNTLHRLIRHYEMVLPTSPLTIVGGVCMSLGLTAMVGCMALMLFEMGLKVDAFVVVMCAFGLMLAFINMRQMHAKKSYVLDV